MMRWKNPLVSVLLVGLLLTGMGWIAGCGGGGGGGGGGNGGGGGITLTGLSINGPTSVNEGATATYTATATWSDNTTSSATATWSVTSGPGTIAASTGVLTAGAVTANGSAVIAASYTFGGVTETASATVAIMNIATRQWGSPQLLETGDAGTADSPQVAVNASGDAVVVWKQSDGIRYNVWANRYTPGTGWSGAQLIEFENGGDVEYPQVAVDTAGAAIVVWHQWDGNRYNIWANRYTPGTGWGAAQMIETDNAGGAYYAHVAMDAAGNAIAVWYQLGVASINVYANRYVPGSGWGSAQKIDPDSATDAENPHVAMDAAGNAIVVWQQWDGTRYNIFANRYTAGIGWGSAQLIESDNAGHARLARVAMDATGNAIAVWSQSDGIRDNFWANRYVVGSGWGTPQLIETDNSGDVMNFPQVALNATGDAVVVWSQSDGIRNNIWSNRYIVGSGWGTAQRIETDDSGDAGDVNVAVDAAGNAVACWRQFDGIRENTWTNSYVVGTGWGAAQLIETDVEPARTPRVGMDAAGNAVVVWSQWDGARNNIWAIRFE